MKHEKQTKPKSEKSWLKRNWVTIALMLVLMVGVGFLAYPSVADYWNSFHQTRTIMSYTEDLSAMDNAQYDAIMERAHRYNREISRTGMRWVMNDSEEAEYYSQLDINGTGNIGFITIDKISVQLPVYLGTEENVLQIGVGHLEGSSLPVGCASWDSREGGVEDKSEGTHAVLSGHRGLPSARLFTDLNKIVEGDTFSLNVLNETLTYQVDQIRVVEPTEVSSLQMFPGRDLCTLVTCTPYGINTHRLLVRGHRIANAMGDIKVVADAFQIEPVYIVPFLAVPVLLLLIVLMLVDSDRAGRHRRALKASLRTLEDLVPPGEKPRE